MKRSTPIHLVIWTIVLGLGAYLAGALLQSRDAAELRARNTALTYARLVSEHASASFERADLILDTLIATLPAGTLEQGQALSSSRRIALQDSFIEARSRMAGITDVVLTDAQGAAIVAASDPKPAATAAGREYFRVLQTERRNDPVISEALRGRASGTWGIKVARRLELPDGHFAGVILINLGIETQFTDFYKSLSIDSGSAIALWGMDKRLMIRHPIVESEIGKPLALQAFEPLFKTRATELAVATISPIDGAQRMIAMRRLERFPLLASVALAESDYLAPWRSQARNTSLALGILLCGGGLLSYMVIRGARNTERVRRLIRETPLGLLTCTAEAGGSLIVRHANPAARRILQTPLAPHLNCRLEELLPSLADSAIPERIRATAEGGETWRISAQAYRDKHIQGLFDVSAFQVSPGVAVMMFDDVSEREVALAALNARERDLLRAEAIAQLGSWRLRLEDHSLSCSDECRRILGVPPGLPVSVATFTVVIHPEDRGRVRSAWRRLLGGGHFDETYRITPDRQVKWVRVRAEHDELNDAGTSVIGTVLDITQQHEAEQRLKDSEDRFHQLFARHASIMLLINPVTGSIIDANTAAADFYGYPLETLVGMNIQDINALPPEEVERERKLALREERNYFIFPHRLADGSLRTVEVYSSPIRSGPETLLFSIMHDVTEKQLAESRLRLAAGVFDNAHEGIIVTDLDGTILEVNRAYCELTGYPRHELLGRNPRILQAAPPDQAFYREMWSKLVSRGFWRGDLHNQRKDGQRYIQETGITAVTDTGGGRTHYIGFAEDVTALRQSQQRLEYLAYHDTLTQLPNRLLLADHIRLALAAARREKRFTAVCYLDLDEFKPINDTWGHAVGDQLLVDVATRLKGCVRAEDTVARLGGDEFVILLASLDSRTECEQALARITAALAGPFNLPAGEVHIGASIGVSLFPLDDVDADSLIRHADQAMYLAKQSGRGSIHFFDPDADRRARDLRDSVAEVSAGLARGEFVLHYQPQVNMRTGAVVGVEALIRWNHPLRGLLPPGAFLPDIEDTEVSVSLGEWVLGEALRQAEIWFAEGLSLRIGINISARHLQLDDFSTRLEQHLAHHPALPPDCIELEILETAALEDLGRISRLMGSCQQLGTSFALDDFGTGYASLAYLKHLPASLLKIDQTFIRDMLADPEDHAIVEGIIGLASAFKRGVIAEGVESLAHGATLLGLGCDLAQGYCIARPMPAKDVARWTRAWRNPPEWSGQESA